MDGVPTRGMKSDPNQMALRAFLIVTADEECETICLNAWLNFRNSDHDDGRDKRDHALIEDGSPVQGVEIPVGLRRLRAAILLCERRNAARTTRTLGGDLRTA